MTVITAVLVGGSIPVCFVAGTVMGLVTGVSFLEVTLLRRKVTDADNPGIPAVSFWGC